MAAINETTPCLAITLGEDLVAIDSNRVFGALVQVEKSK